MVQLVAFSGGLLGPVLDDTTTNCLAVGLYRTMVGQPATVAVYLGDWNIKGVSIAGATLTDMGPDESGQIYLVTATPTEERVTMALNMTSGFTCRSCCTLGSRVTRQPKG